VYWREFGEFRPTAVYDGPALSPAASIDGPAIIDYPDTTVVLPPGASARVDTLGNVVIDVGSAPSEALSGRSSAAVTA
jgi:N-methylhydantoinase A